MTKPINVAVAGVGAFGVKHLESLGQIDGVNLLSVVDSEVDRARDVAMRFGAPHHSSDLIETLALPGLDAVILCTPTPMHARQDRKSTRLNSSHVKTSYAVFCLT